MKPRTALAISLFLVAVTLVWNLADYQGLPATIPTHWGFSGPPNAYGPKSQSLVCGFVLLGVAVSAVFAMTLAPEETLNGVNRKQASALAVLVSLWICYIDVVLFSAMKHPQLPISALLFLSIFIFFVAFGIVLKWCR